MYRNLFLLLFAWMCVACGDDESVLPSYRQDLADMRTDSYGRTVSLLFDDGRTGMVTASPAIFPKDTLMRVSALYETDGVKVHLHQAVAVFSPLPIVIPEDSMQTDPVMVKALWRANVRYVNFLISRRTGGGTQYFAFIDAGLRRGGGDSRVRTLRLYHDQNGDAAFYTVDSYLSCPTGHYADSLREGIDSIEVIVNGYGGEVMKRFLY